MTLTLATRGSELALWQARHVRTLLQSSHASLEVAIDVLRTTGDRITDVPLAMIGDRGLFTKEVDDAVLDGRADVAVHSFKDVPTALTPGLAVAAVLPREDPRDAFVPAPGRPVRLQDLTAGSAIGTSSLRRRSLLLAARPDLRAVDLRGNLDTRLQKLADGLYDGIIVACAGLRRLSRDGVIGELLGPPHWLPAAGQGALAIVCRAGDTATFELLAGLDDVATRAAATAERAFLGELEGGCQVPVGAWAQCDGDDLVLQGLAASLDGSRIIRGEGKGAIADAADVGRRLAVRLIADGAADVLREARAAAVLLPRPAAP